MSNPLPHKDDPEYYEFADNGWAIPWALKQVMALARMVAYDKLSAHLQEQIKEKGMITDFAVGKDEFDAVLVFNLTNDETSELMQRLCANWIASNRHLAPYKWRGDGLENQVIYGAGYRGSFTGKARVQRLAAQKEKAKKYF